MKIKFILFTFLLFSSLCHAKYTPLMLSELIDKSDLIGNCEITQVTNKQIIVKFHEFFKGSSKIKFFKIDQFENWTCARRWTSYKIGQKEFIFLKYSQNGKLTILGSGNEGEMPIQIDKLYYKSPYPYLDKNATIYKFNSQEISGYLFTISDAKNGIKQYLSNKQMFHEMARSKSKKFQQLKNKFLKRLIFELRSEIYMIS